MDDKVELCVHLKLEPGLKNFRKKKWKLDSGKPEDG